MERQILPDRPDSLCFALHWTHRPELSLESEAWPGGCFAALFVEYLVGRFGPDLLRDVWQEAEETERPAVALRRLLAVRGETLATASAVVKDVFGAGHCVDSYCRLPAGVKKRFGERSVTESLKVEVGKSVSLRDDDAVDHLACRYYRLYPDGNVASIRVMLKPRSVSSACDLKATLLRVSGSGELEETVALTRTSSERDAASGPLRGTICVGANMSSFIVLVVANVYTPSTCPTGDLRLTQHYTFEALAEG